MQYFVISKFSGDAISNLCSAAASYNGQIVPVEDVFITGILAEKANIPRICHSGKGKGKGKVWARAKEKTRVRTLSLGQGLGQEQRPKQRKKKKRTRSKKHRIPLTLKFVRFNHR